MTPTCILRAYLAIALIDLAWSLFLTVLNYRNVHRRGDEVPEGLRQNISQADAAKACAYGKARMRLGFINTPIMTAILLVAAASGFFGAMDTFIGGYISSPYWRGAIFLGALMIAQALLNAPSAIYSTFFLEKRYGFNRTTIKTWLLDILKGATISVVLALPLLALLYAFIDRTGPLWWLWAATIFSIINIFLSLLYPALIAPLFNKFTPLPEGSLNTRVRDLAAKLNFGVRRILLMDGSKRSRHSNAYFTGFGRAKRIVLYDTLVDQLSEDQILAVLAHEIGHEKKHHILTMTVLSVAMSFLIFRLLALFMGWDALYAAFGFGVASKHAILLIVSLIVGPATFFLEPLFSLWSRAHEYQADTYAVEATNGEALASALIRLNQENATNLWPHPLYSFWYYSHPTLGERLTAIRYTEVCGRDAPSKRADDL